MLELGMYFKVTEGAALASLYVEKEKETISSKLGAQLDWIGEKYNGLSLGKKALLAVGLVGSSIALGATGGAGIAVGAVAVRRFCAGLGGAVAIDAAAEKFFSGRQEKKAHTETTDFIEQEKWASSPELMKRFDTFLALENDSIDKQIDKKRTKMFFRKWSLRMGGAFGLAALSELWQAHDAVASVTPPADTLPPVLPDQIGGDMPDASVSEAAIPEATAAITETPIAPTPSIPESYTLSAPDSNQGLWGVLDKSLPAELDEAHKNQAITSLQNLIATKLEDMSPEDRAAAGFRSGDINTIYAGDTLKLDGLVSQTELQEIIDGKIIDPPAVEVDVPTALEVPEVAYGADAPNADIPQTASLEGAGGSVDRVAVASTSDTLLNQVNEGSLIDTDTDGEPVDGTAKLLGEGGIERAVYYQELENTRRSIFATNDLRFRDSILNAPKVKMADIILAAKSPGETLVENQALFGTDQITRLNRFKELAVSAYGKIAEPGSRETVADYTRRLVTLGFESPESKINIDKLARV
jgi:hypothetical protein